MSVTVFDTKKVYYLRKHYFSMSRKELSEHLGVSDSAIGDQLRRMNLNQRDARSRIIDEKILGIVGNGMTQRSIARSLKISETTVCSHMKKLGITAEGKSRSWSQDDSKKLLECVRRGFSISQTSKVTKRSMSDCFMQLSKITNQIIGERVG